MVLNPYFQQGSKSEQNLVQSLINEQLKIYGVDVHFMPRKYVSSDSVLREVSASSFEDAYPIEAYIDNFDGYGDNPTLLSKFGIEQTNEVTLIISKERFENYISPLMKNESNIKLSTRPKEGDLIYFPFGDRLFEIKYVEHEKPFYMLKNTYVYELRCELFRYEDEVIDTGVDEIDDTLEATEGVDGADYVIGTTQKLTLIGDAEQATAVTTQVHGGIQYVEITDRGSGYTYAPRVAISSAPAGGVTGIATAYLRGGLFIGAGYDAASNKSVVQNVNLVNPGSGYTTGPEMQFYGGGGVGLAVTAYMANGTIGIVTVTGGGSGYTTSPAITFTGLSTVSAAATAVVSTAGTISAIHITNAGAGYTTPPTIAIAAPTGTSSGTFVFNEIVTGGTSGATARVRTWNSVTNEIEISNVEGEFSREETLTGSTSGASRVVRLIDLTNYDDGFGDNDIFQTEADDILDFSEGNPFGTP